MSESAFDRMNRGALGSTGAGMGGLEYNGAASNLVFTLTGVKLRNTDGLLAGTQGVTEKPIPGAGTIFYSQNGRRSSFEKLMDSIRDGFKSGAQGSVAGGGATSPSMQTAAAAPMISGGVDVGPDQSWVNYVNSRGTRGGGGVEVG